MPQPINAAVQGLGGLIAFDIPVVVGQTLRLINESTEKKAECRIVLIHRGRDGKTYTGFEFAAPQSNFWHMTFTAPGAKPLRRVMSLKISSWGRKRTRLRIAAHSEESVSRATRAAPRTTLSLRSQHRTY